jgi:phosphoribosylaminoimidazolecarboxamide formyltransferase/IMP cyclohydrolase
MPRALLSVSDKAEIVSLARGLVARGFQVVSTGGTARTLTDAGVPVTNVSDLTGFPEMLDGRVKTLHPKIHGGILARRSHPEDLGALEQQGIGLIDLVVVNLYPFEATARKPGVAFDELIENIDIGGPSMVRAAAKNFRDVLVVVDPADYPRVLEAIDRGPDISFRYELMRKAIAHTGAYDTAISETLATRSPDGSAVPPAADPDARIGLTLDRIRVLRYGENPHQRAYWYRPSCAGHSAVGISGFGFGAAEVLQGRELSYTNLLDLDSAARIVLEFREPAAVVIKHTNPCGAATGASLAEAYIQARDADSLAAFGGIVGVNRAIDAAAAEAIVSTFIEAVVAPAVDADARAILARRANMRVVVADFSSIDRLADQGLPVELRSILGAVLGQERDRVTEAQAPWMAASLPGGFRVVTRRQPTDAEWEALRFAWRVCAHVKSNAVVFTNASRTLAIGAGQMSRVDAVHVAVAKAAASHVSLGGSVAASDAFFPFRDGLEATWKAGATAIVQPGGSVRDAEVIAAADEHDVAMVFTARRHFRH